MSVNRSFVNEADTLLAAIAQPGMTYA